MTFIADIKGSIYSSRVNLTVTRNVLSILCHCEEWNWKSGSMSLSSSSRNLRNAFVPRQLVQRCISSPFDALHTTLLTISLYETSQFRVSTNKMLFWWVVQKHTKCVPDEPAMTHHLGQRVQNLENPIFTSGFLFFKCNKQFMEIAQNWPLWYKNTVQVNDDV